ncbi:hypothetical protein CMUS01_07791 [Colletotrichum musicola]|uniref:Uncharacterized protein n=1 Tax=Colletotrichum musicola TaxID=2175873 RepID=A0A8H6KF76_9PEZI|nr:hypothetical protein CMUS01_07791 [Colletotrichum musicola]
MRCVYRGWTIPRTSLHAAFGPVHRTLVALWLPGQVDVASVASVHFSNSYFDFGFFFFRLIQILDWQQHGARSYGWPQGKWEGRMHGRLETTDTPLVFTRLPPSPCCS